MRFKIIAIVITPYSPSCLGEETVKGTFGLPVKLPPAHLSTTHDESFTLSLSVLNVKQRSWEYQICSLWFDPTGNRTRVYRFSNRRSIHLNTDRLNDVIYTAKQFREQSLKLYDFCENETTAT